MRKTVLGLAALLLAACGTPVPNGTVVDKYYSAPYTWWMSQCFSYNAQGMCTYWGLIPIDEPARWVITLENCDLKEEGDDSCPQERHNVQQWYYDQTDLGDYADFRDE